MPQSVHDVSEAIAWMTSTGAGVTAAVGRFFPDVTGVDRAKIHAQIRKAAQRARDAGGPAPRKVWARPDLRPDGTPPPPKKRTRKKPDLVVLPDLPTLGNRAKTEEPPPADRLASPPSETDGARPSLRYDLVDSEKVEFLRWQLAEAIADITIARKINELKAIALLDGRIESIRANLDAAREAAGKPTAIERTPDAVAAALTKKAKLLEQLRAAHSARSREL